MAHFKTIDGSSPYDFLTNFINKVSLLPKAAQRSCIHLVQGLFSDKSYHEAPLPIPEKWSTRFVDFDIRSLLSLIKKHEFKINCYRLLANISKVAGIALKDSKVRRVYQAEVLIEGHTYWGWIPAAWVDTSPKLKKHLNPETLKLSYEKLTPDLLSAFQDLCELEFVEDSSVQLPLSWRTFALVWQFAHKTGSQALLEKLYEALHSLDADTRHQLNLFDSNISCPKDYVPKEKTAIPLSLSEEETTGSKLFNENTPYESITRFVKNAPALSIMEKKAFFSAVSDFFTTAAFERKTLPLDNARKNLFARELSFLLFSIQFSPKSEIGLARVVMNIQLVTQTRFFGLPIVGEVLVFSAKYGNETTPFRESLFGLSAQTIKSPGHAPLEIISIPSGKPAIVSDDKTDNIKVVCGLIELALREDSPVTWAMAVKQIYACVQKEKKWKKLSTWIVGHLNNPALANQLKGMVVLPPIKPDFGKIDAEAAARFALLEIERTAKEINEEVAVNEVLKSFLSIESLDFKSVMEKLEKLNTDAQIAAKLKQYPSSNFLRILENKMGYRFRHFFEKFARKCTGYTLDGQAAYVSLHINKKGNPDKLRAYNLLSDKKLTTLAEIAGYADSVKGLKYALIRVSPDILGNGLKKLLMDSLAFKQKQNESMHSMLLSIISFIIKGESVYAGKTGFAELNFSLTEHDKVRILKFLESDACKDWIERDPELKELRRSIFENFKKIHKIHGTLSIRDQIQRLNPSLSKPAAAFLYEFLENQPTSDNFESDIHSLIEKHVLLPGDLKALFEIMSSETASNWPLPQATCELFKSLTAIPEWLEDFKTNHLGFTPASQEAVLAENALLMAWHFNDKTQHRAHYLNRSLFDFSFSDRIRLRQDHLKQGFLEDSNDSLINVYKKFKAPATSSYLNSLREGLSAQVYSALETSHSRLPEFYSAYSFVNSDQVKQVCPSSSTRDTLEKFLCNAVFDGDHTISHLKIQIQNCPAQEISEMKEALKCPGGPQEAKERLSSLLSSTILSESKNKALGLLSKLFS